MFFLTIIQNSNKYVNKDTFYPAVLYGSQKVDNEIYLQYSFYFYRDQQFLAAIILLRILLTRLQIILLNRCSHSNIP